VVSVRPAPLPCPGPVVVVAIGRKHAGRRAPAPQAVTMRGRLE
jgi:hypothetical protein